MHYEKVKQLYQCATAYQFEAFHALLAEMSPAILEEAPEAYLMRAQIKLYCADVTCLDDLKKVEHMHFCPQFPCLPQKWALDNPNRFFVFPVENDSVKQFLDTLPQVASLFEKWYGEAGYNMVLQIQSEILYFSAEPEKALLFIDNPKECTQENSTDVFLRECVQFRCHLALGNAQEAANCMMKMIQLAKENPACLTAYEAIRRWANLTTGWSGDTNRFYEEQKGLLLPDLEDRLEAIQIGFSKLTPHEKPFVECANHFYENAYSLQEYYMDIFNALYWYHSKDANLAKTHFLKAHKIAVATGLTMPFVEYGKQIAPLLEQIQSESVHYASWAAHILKLANLYEISLEQYRD